MNPAVVLEKFRSGEFNPNFGEAVKNLTEFNSIEEVATAFKNQETLNPYQLISRVLYLTGVSKEKASLASLVLSQFASGRNLFNLSTLVDLPIGLITLACGHHNDYDDLISPIPVVSLDQGRTWLGPDRDYVKSYPLKTWMARRFHELYSMISLYPNEDRYKHDFRAWALFEPTESGFAIKPGSLHRVGRRSTNDDVEQIERTIKAFLKAGHVEPIQKILIDMNGPPLFIIPGQQIVPRTASSIPRQATHPFIVPGQQTIPKTIQSVPTEMSNLGASRDRETGEPPSKKARKD